MIIPSTLLERRMDPKHWAKILGPTEIPVKPGDVLRLQPSSETKDTETDFMYIGAFKAMKVVLSVENGKVVDVNARQMHATMRVLVAPDPAIEDLFLYLYLVDLAVSGAEVVLGSQLPADHWTKNPKKLEKVLEMIKMVDSPGMMTIGMTADHKLAASEALMFRKAYASWDVLPGTFYIYLDAFVEKQGLRAASDDAAKDPLFRFSSHGSSMMVLERVNTIQGIVTEAGIVRKPDSTMYLKDYKSLSVGSVAISDTLDAAFV